jgi:hypothetical protein
MTAVLYLATAVAVIAIAHRLRPLPPRAAAAIVLLPLCLVGCPLLTGAVAAPVDIAYTAEPLASMASEVGAGPVVNTDMTDAFAQFLPWKSAVRWAYAQREWPLWNPFELCGNVLAGAAQSAPYHPVQLLGLFLDEPQAATFEVAMLFFLAMLGGYLFLRELLLSELASLFGAAAWMASTYVVSFAGTAHGMSIAMLPFVLFAARRLAENASARSTMLLAGALALLLLSGHPETAAHTVVLAAAWFFFSVRDAGKRLDARRVAVGLAAGVLALLVTAIFTLPILDALGQTAELSHRTHVRDASVPAAASLHRLMLSFLPFLEGAHGEAAQHTPGTAHGWVASAFCGALVFPPALYGLTRGARRRQRWFFGALLVFGLLAGVKARGVTELLDALPLFSLTLNERMISFAALALVALSAMGLDAWPRQASRMLPILFVAMAATVALIVILLRPDLGGAALSPNFLRIAAARMIVPSLLAAALCVAYRSPRAVTVGLLALLLVERTIETSALRPVVARSTYYPPIAGLPAPAAGEPFRIVAAGPLLTPNLATHYRLEDARGYEAVTLGRYADLLPLWSTPQPVWSNRVDDLHAPLLSMLNVRYALAPARSAPPEGWLARGGGAGFALFENTRVLGRAFVPHVVHFARRDASLAAMRAAHDFSDDAWIEDGGPERTIANGSGRVELEQRGTRLRLHAQVDRDAWIVISQSAWRGWRAREAGRELPLFIGNHAFLALHLPAGEHVVKLLFLPQSFVIGRAITFATIALLIVAAVVGRMRKGRQARA